jgi:hypothetical protein
MDIEPDDGAAERARAGCEEILREHGAAATLKVVAGSIEGEARFLAARLGPAAAYGLVSAVADRIVDRSAVRVAEGSGGLARFLPRVFGPNGDGPNGDGPNGSGRKRR